MEGKSDETSLARRYGDLAGGDPDAGERQQRFSADDTTAASGRQYCRTVPIVHEEIAAAQLRNAVQDSYFLLDVSKCDLHACIL